MIEIKLFLLLSLCVRVHLARAAPVRSRSYIYRIYIYIDYFLLCSAGGGNRRRAAAANATIAARAVVRNDDNNNNRYGTVRAYAIQRRNARSVTGFFFFFLMKGIRVSAAALVRFSRVYTHALA